MTACNLRDGYACYGGAEIWNVCRTLEYVDNLLPRNGFQLTVKRDDSGNFCCGCCDEAYSDPVTDEPPWYDPALPESGGFFGIIPTDIEGLSYNPTQRSAGEGTSGFSLSKRHENGREINVVAVAYADSCEAMDYGLAWLQATLERDCDLAGFTWQACCPSTEESPSDFDALGYRSIPCVGLTEGITAEPYAPTILGGYAYEIEFTLIAGRSWIYDQPVTLFDGLIIPGDEYVCVEYTPTCIDGAAIEVFVDRSLNTGTSEFSIYSAPLSYLPPGDLLKNNAMFGVDITAGPGESIFYDPRCLGVAIASLTGKAVRPARNVALVPNARSLFPDVAYGKGIRICVSAVDNGLGQIGVRIKAHSRRRI